MPTVNITETEINPTDVVGYGGGRREPAETEINPTYKTNVAVVITEIEVPPALPAPQATTDPATSVEATTATLNGTLDSGGGIEPCDCGFEWGETDAYGETTPTQSRTTGQTFAQAITGLTPGITYHFRAFASGAISTVYGADETFTIPTAPTVTSDPASAVGQTTATLNGTLDIDGGEACDCSFEYGETTDYGSTTATQSKTTGETFSQEVRGFKGGSVYHFRAKATNSVGTSYGADRTFHTEALSAEAHQALGRHYSMGRHGL